jgi:hypothetical protein
MGMNTRCRQVSHTSLVKTLVWNLKTNCTAAFLWLLNKIEGNLDYE